MSRIEAIISDFGGVLTSPLINTFAAFQQASGIPLESLGTAIAAIAQRLGTNPLYELETGRLTEHDFMNGLAAQLTSELGRPVELDGFGEGLFAHMDLNEPMLDYMRELKGRGYRLAICTNNVREWEGRWRAMFPVDEVFDVVVDSAFVGVRKPDARIFEITLERLGVQAASAVFVDDLQLNCDAARELGLTTVFFRDTDQAIEEIEAALA